VGLQTSCTAQTMEMSGPFAGGVSPIRTRAEHLPEKAIHCAGLRVDNHSMHMRAMLGRAGAVLWMACLQFFLVERIVARGWNVPGIPYSFSRNFVSDLGAKYCGFHGALTVCSPLHAWMNISFGLQGLLIFTGAILVRRVYASSAGCTAGLNLLKLSGLGLFAVGIAPEDVHAEFHITAAALHFICGGAAMIVLGVMSTRGERKSWLCGLIAGFAGVAVLVATLLLGLHITRVLSSLSWPLGAIERVPTYAIPLWVVCMGITILREDRSGAFGHDADA
jgi:hypothetical membrane protein